MATESIHVTALIPARPEAVYNAWLSSERHTQMTGGGAQIDPRVGGSHSAWGDYISGKTLELVPGARIVQSWRTLEFPAESGDSKITVTFEPDGDDTLVSIAHDDIPEGQGARYASGWYDHYFTPMTTYFSDATGEPAKKPARRKPAAKKKATARKGAKKPAAKKATAKKGAAKKGAAKKGARKPAAKKAARKTAAKKPAARKAATKKPAARKAVRKPAAKKPARKPAPAPTKG